MQAGEGGSISSQPYVLNNQSATTSSRRSRSARSRITPSHALFPLFKVCRKRLQFFCNVKYKKHFIDYLFTLRNTIANV